MERKTEVGLKRGERENWDEKLVGGREEKSERERGVGEEKEITIFQ